MGAFQQIAGRRDDSVWAGRMIMKLAAADVPTAQQDEIPREAHERVSAAGESAVDLYGPADDAVRESIEALSLSGAPFVQPGIPRRDILVLSLGFGALLTALLGIVQLVDEGMSSAWRSTGLFEATRTHSLGVHSTWWWALGAALCVGFSFVMSHRGDPIPAPSPSGLSNEAWLAVAADELTARGDLLPGQVEGRLAEATAFAAEAGTTWTRSSAAPWASSTPCLWIVTRRSFVRP